MTEIITFIFVVLWLGLALTHAYMINKASKVISLHRSIGARRIKLLNQCVEEAEELWALEKMGDNEVKIAYEAGKLSAFTYLLHNEREYQNHDRPLPPND